MTRTKHAIGSVGHPIGGPLDGLQVEVAEGTRIGDVRTFKYWSVNHWMWFSYRVVGFRFRPEMEYLLRPERI